MKGLLYKDLCLSWKNSKILIPSLLIYFVMGLFLEEMFTIMLPFSVVILSSLCTTLVSSDESSGWYAYAATMPISRAKIVSSQYILILIYSAGFSFLFNLLLGMNVSLNDDFSFDVVLFLIVMPFCISQFISVLMMPFLYWLGVAKGRFAYSAIIFALLILFALFGNHIFVSDILSSASLTVFTLVFFTFSMILLAVSWCASIWIFKRKDIA